MEEFFAWAVTGGTGVNGLKEYKPLLSVPQKSKMAEKEGYVGQNLKFDLQGGGCRSFIAVTHFYDA